MEPSCFRHVLKSSRVLTIQYESGGGGVGPEGSNLEFSKHRCDEAIMLSKWVKKGDSLYCANSVEDHRWNRMNP